MWPENWDAWVLFCEMSGQWRTAGMDGHRLGLDYTPLFARMDRMRLDDARWDELFHDVRTCEHAALEQMRKT